MRKTSWLARSSHYRRLRLPWDFPTKATWRVTSVRCSALRPDSSGGRSVRIGRGFTAGWCAGSLQSADCHRHASPDLSAGSIGPGGLRGRMSCGRSRCALQETRHQNVVLGDSGPKSRFGRRFPHTETSPYVRNAAISRHFERDPIPYALETDWPLEAGGFEPLHFRIGIREDSQPGAAGFELTHLN